MSRPLSRLLRRLLLAALPLGLALGLLLPSRVWAGPVSWKEVPPTAEGRQWWDEGSLRRNRAGYLTVLSRFQAAPDLGSSSSAPGAGVNSGKPLPPPGSEPGERLRADAQAAPAANRPPAGDQPASTPAGSLPPAVDQRALATGRSSPPISRLYVMELDCDQSLYRDISINGLPQFGASWQPTGSDDLTAEVLRQACSAEAA